MSNRRTLMTLALAAGAVASSLAAAAAIVNPDNDSAAYFAYDARAASAPGAPATMLRAGDVSSDRLYVYSASDRGWVQRSHSFVVDGHGLAHAADCLPYDTPKPAIAIVPGNLQRGAFGEHGA